MLRVEPIRRAADDLMAAAVLGEGWEEALHGLSEAACAQGAVLMRNRGHRMVAAVTTREVAEAVADFAAGRTPPNSRYRRVNHTRSSGFRVDHDDYDDRQLAKDPFYQEFLRPIGYFWHANVGLTSGRDESVEISLKRHLNAGAYRREDATLLDAALPSLRAAVRLGRQMFDAETRGMARLLLARGRPVIELDAWGRPLAVHPDAEAVRDGPLRIVGRQLTAANGAAQAAVDRAVSLALTRPGEVALAPLGEWNGRNAFLQVLPVPGRVRDIFLSAAALAVPIEQDAPWTPVRLSAAGIREAFALTGRETDIACLLAEGLSLAAISRRLDIQPGTARTHLKSIFEKTGTRRQAELAALFGRLGG